ncbi:MAG: WD40/YVTN/BNR-like repeat-containing protein [Ktedonobacteraceae bacterium]
MKKIHAHSIQSKWLIGPLLSLLMLFVAACGGSTTGNQATAVPTQVPVNGFGSAANHTHAMLALPHNVLVLATHYGLFRSADGGKTWKEVAGGPNQLMYGSMETVLGVSPLNPQRLYVLTQIALAAHDTLGLYTSDDQGQTWKLAVAANSGFSSDMYLEEPGNDTPNEVYIYRSDLGNRGLQVSMDDGQHFSTPGTLPFGSIQGLLAIPNAPGHLLAFGASGIARSTDGGLHWQVLKGISGGVYDMAISGPNSPIYASGDVGIMVSQDEGVTFKLVNSQASYTALAVSPTQPQVLYGKTGLAAYRSTNGGQTWQPLPHINGNLAVLAVNPNNPSLVYLSLSYPTELYQIGPNDATWQSLTPQVQK